ncbi:MAG: hypothetical protein ACK4NA_00275 [Alphaproteobacteria bacterium]
MHPFVEKVLLFHRLGRRVSDAGAPDAPQPQTPSIDDIPLIELLEQADQIADMIAKREHLAVDDEKAILAAAFLALRRREKKSAPGAPSGIPRSFLLFA